MASIHRHPKRQFYSAFFRDSEGKLRCKTTKRNGRRTAGSKSTARRRRKSLNLFAIVRRDLTDAKARQVSADWRFGIAYNGALKLYTVLLVAQGYLIEAPIRLFVFSDRIEIVSPGHLPNSLTVEKIRTGNSNIRNPILASYVAKGMLPYHGIGSGIKRALEDWPDIIFTDDRDGCLFVSTVLRKPAVSGAGDALTGASEESLEETPGKTPMKTLGKTPVKIMELLMADPKLSIPELARALSKSESAVERVARKLRETGYLRRIGPDKGRHWEVVNNALL